MTAAEYQVGLKLLANARPAFLELEDLALELAASEHAGRSKGLLLCFKEQLHATRLLALEVGELCRNQVP